MRRLAVLCALGLVLGGCAASAAQLTISGTAPTQGNDGSCGSPALVPFEPGVSLLVRVTWAGPSSGVDSAFVAPGARFSFIKQVLPGTYTINALAKNGALVGCDTTITKVAKAVPAKVALD